MWVVLSIRTDIEIETSLGNSTLKLDWADGMVGALPVFDTRANADKYAMGGAIVMEVREIMPEHTA